MKISHRTENACIIENKKYVFSNLTKNEVEQILATQANSINSRIFEQEDLEFMQNFADAMNEPYQNRWAKYIELLSDGKLKDSRKDDPKFPTEEIGRAHV